jgi:hypothetical protein
MFSSITFSCLYRWGSRSLKFLVADLVTCFQFPVETISLHDHPVSYPMNVGVSFLGDQVDHSPL